MAGRLSALHLFVLMISLWSYEAEQVQSLAIPSSSSRSSSSSSKRNNQSRVTPSSSNKNRNNNSKKRSTHSRNRVGYDRRKEGTISNRNRKRTPRWETEGDHLYQEIQKQRYELVQEIGNNSGSGGGAIGIEQAKQMLSKLTRPRGGLPTSKVDQKLKTTETTPTVESAVGNIDCGDNALHFAQSSPPSEKKPSAPPHMLWGTLPVGPILSARLREFFSDPTPIQTAAFPVLSKSSQNAVLASPTGTGKTLAYLVPLLATAKTSRHGTPCSVVIVTPTVELATQIRKQQIDVLWLPTAKTGESNKEGKESNNREGSACHVVGEHRREVLQGSAVKNDDNDEDDKEENSMPLLCSHMQHASILAGTPRMLRELLKEIENKDGASDSELATAVGQALKSNLRTIVLDEADRLLRTEAVAREAAGAAAGANGPSSAYNKRRRPYQPTQTEMLLSELPCSLDKVQIICASATVGRTLRRQLMTMLDTTSIDKAAALITADARATGKDVEKRTASLVPDTITHSFRFIPCDGESGKVGDTGTAKTGTRSKNDDQEETCGALWTTLKDHLNPPAPTLVFPNRLGVETVQAYLRERCGLQNVLSLGDAKNNVEEEADSNSNVNEWKNTPVYVVGDKFGRGLDIPGIANVVLLAPPSSAAGYTHLAGRTGRNGNPGRVVTLVRPQEVTKLAAIAELLRLSFEDLLQDKESAVLSAGAEGLVRGEEVDVWSAETDEATKDRVIRESNSFPWSNLSDSALKRKTVTELNGYLISHGVTMGKDSETRVLKADLLRAVQRLHEDNSKLEE